MRIDPASHVPIYLQIVAYIRQAVAAGVYRPGEMLPSLRALALDLTVNPNTVQRAYDQLEREGLVRSRRGVGLFVASGGTRAARNESEAAVREAFARGIQMARAADLTEQRIGTLFERARRQVAAQGRTE